jgi:hypothetical protein
VTIRLSEQAVEALTDAPRHVRTALEKQLCFLSADLHHPSLRAEKYDASRDLWQARVNRDWRFYRNIVGDTFVIRDVIPHPK